MANNDGKGYTLGDLSFSLLFEDNSAINSINETTKALKKLNSPLKSLSNINVGNIKNNLTQISKLDFSNVAKSVEPLKDLKIPVVNQLKKLSEINLDKIDFRKLYNQFNQLTRIVTPFLNKLNESETALKAFSQSINLSKIDKQLNKVNKTAEKTNISFNKVFSIGRLYFWINYTKRFAQALSRMMTRAIDFNETLNKFQVSMGQYYSRAIKYVNSLTYAFNLSTESIMNYQSTFMNMLSALGGLSSDTSYELSETLTRMAIDYASLFNVSIDRAMEQFQSVLSGQIKFSLASKGLLEKFTPLNNGKSKQVKL